MRKGYPFSENLPGLREKHEVLIKIKTEYTLLKNIYTSAKFPIHCKYITSNR